MAEGKARDAWNHTAQLSAVIFNTRAFAKGGGKNPADFNPFAAADRARRAKEAAPKTKEQKDRDFGRIISILTGSRDEAGKAMQEL